MNICRKDLLNAFGAFALIALASIVVHAFCELAMADELPASAPFLAAPAQVLGTYRVTGIRRVAGSTNTDDCSNQDGQYPDRHCSQYVWIVKNDKQLAMLQAKPSSDDSNEFETGILDGFFIHRACDAFIKKDSALQGGIFAGHFCRAYLDTQHSSHATDTYAFGSDVPEISKLPIQGAGLEVVTLIFLAGTHVESRFSVAIPHGEASPKKIQITETVSGSATVIASSFKRIYSLEYVAH